MRTGKGAYASQPVGQAVRDIARAEGNITRIENELRSGNLGRADRRRVRSEAGEWQQKQAVAARLVRDLTAPSSTVWTAWIDSSQTASMDCGRRQQRQEWMDRHPEAARRLDDLTAEIAVLDNQLGRGRVVTGRGFSRELDYPWLREAQSVERDLGIDL